MTNEEEVDNGSNIESERECKRYTFQKLTPISDSDLNIYDQTLNFVFEEVDLLNVAITGSYSAGKSSVIESYKEKNIKKRFIHVSLAHFEETEKNEEDLDDQSEASTKIIEGKILNQLIHQIDIQAIPQTNFKIKRPISKDKIRNTTIISTMYFVFFMFNLNKEYWFVNLGNLSNKTLTKLFSFIFMDWFFIINICVGIVLFCFGFNYLLTIQANKNLLKKFTIQNNEIELFNEDDNFFDKYLNEILYLLRNSDADAIVFEDMDRYNSNYIFEKLREINYILNKGTNKINKKIIFIYLLRDDIFSTKDRTKFFDFIIPIVPIINSSNSYDKLVEYLKLSDIYNNFDNGFLQEVSMYIDDMRLLKNIFNEYIIYHERIQLTELNCNKLLGMIIYKNMFPKDFTELQSMNGFVYCLFRNKESFINDKITQLNNDIQEKEILASEIFKEQCNDIDELDANYIVENIEVNNKGAEEFPTRAEFIKYAKNNKDSIYYYNTSTKYDLEKELQKLQNNSSYNNRKKLLESSLKNTKNEIKELNVKIKKIKNLTLSELAMDKNLSDIIFSTSFKNEIGTIFEYNDVKSSNYFPIIKYLIRNKYIDENYHDYMTYFYEQSISRTDQIFIRSVIDVDSKPYDYKLDDICLVVSKISERYFSTFEILNYDVFEYLLENADNKVRLIFDQLKQNKRIDFVEGYWKTRNVTDKFYLNLNSFWSEFWINYLETTSVEYYDKKRYLYESFKFCPNELIMEMNKDDKICTFISNDIDFLKIDDTITDNMIDLIIYSMHELNVNFIDIDFENSNIRLLDEVYKNDLFEINKSLIFKFLERYYSVSDLDLLCHKNYSIIMSKPEEPLAALINIYLKNYLDEYFEFCNNLIYDDENFVIDLLNKNHLPIEYKEKYLGYLNTRIQSLDNINDKDLWSVLLQKNLIICKKENILSYFMEKNKEFDEVLIDFINCNEYEGKLTYKYLEDMYDSDSKNKFIGELIKCNKILNEKYCALLGSLVCYYEKFSFLDIDDDKIEFLIEFKIIKMTKDNLIFFRENYEKCVIKLILSNISTYIDIVIKVDLFELEELNQLLKFNIKQKYLIELLSLTKEKISVKDIRFKEKLFIHILENNFYEDDLEFVVGIYNKSSKNLRDIILAVCESNINYIIENEIYLSYNLLYNLINKDVNVNMKKLLAYNMKRLNADEINNCLKRMGQVNILTSLNGKNPLVKVTEGNTSLLQALKEKQMISSFKKDKKKEDYYKVNSKRRKKQIN